MQTNVLVSLKQSALGCACYRKMLFNYRLNITVVLDDTGVELEMQWHWWWIMSAWVTVGCPAYSTTNSLEPAKALGWMWVSCLLFSKYLRERKRNREMKYVSWQIIYEYIWSIHILPQKSFVCNYVHACDSQFVHLCAVESVTRHLLDAISGEPSVNGKQSQVTELSQRKWNIQS